MGKYFGNKVIPGGPTKDAFKSGGGGGGDGPATAPPAVMPSPALDDEAVKKAKKDALAAAQARNGRASTILTDNREDKLG